MGEEGEKPMYRSAIEAEDAFYEAFAQQDVEAMMRVWAEDRPVFCIHPGGDLLTGREEVEESWKQIFGAEVPSHFELEYHYREEFDGQFAISQLTETLYLRHHVVGIVLATNVYCGADEGWRMIMHHASPPPGPDAPESGMPVLH